MLKKGNTLAIPLSYLEDLPTSAKEACFLDITPHKTPFGSLHLTLLRGTVLDARVWSESHVTGSGGGGSVVGWIDQGSGFLAGSKSNVQIGTQVITRREVWIQDEAGREHCQSLPEFFPTRAGQEISLYFAQPPEGQNRELVGLRNHSSGLSFLGEEAALQRACHSQIPAGLRLVHWLLRTLLLALLTLALLASAAVAFCGLGGLLLSHDLKFCKLLGYALVYPALPLLASLLVQHAYARVSGRNSLQVRLQSLLAEIGPLALDHNPTALA